MDVNIRNAVNTPSHTLESPGKVKLPLVTTEPSLFTAKYFEVVTEHPIAVHAEVPHAMLIRRDAFLIQNLGLPVFVGVLSMRLDGIVPSTHAVVQDVGEVEGFGHEETLDPTVVYDVVVRKPLSIF